MRVLLTDGRERSTLAAARSLCAAGHDVHVVADRRLSLAGASRGVTPHVSDHSALHRPSEYARALECITRKTGARALIPMTDASAQAVLEYRFLYPPRFIIPLPPSETFRAASDKVGMQERARAAGFAVAQSVTIHGRDEKPAMRHLLPAVIKSYRSVVFDTASNQWHKTTVQYARTESELHRILETTREAAFPLLVQEHIHGPGEGVFLLRWYGQTLATFAHRRIREKPPEGGVSVYRESIAPRRDLTEPAARLLDSLDWEGVAMVETKRQLSTGRNVFMEVNGRFWGSLQLAVDAGADFPAWLLQCASGGNRPPSHGYKIGVRSRWWWGDLDHLYLSLRRPSPAKGTSRAAARLRSVRDFLTVRPGQDRNEVWRWRDPLPAVVESAERLGILR